MWVEVDARDSKGSSKAAASIEADHWRLEAEVASCGVESRVVLRLAQKPEDVGGIVCLSGLLIWMLRGARCTFPFCSFRFFFLALQRGKRGEISILIALGRTIAVEWGIPKKIIGSSEILKSTSRPTTDLPFSSSNERPKMAEKQTHASTKPTPYQFLQRLLEPSRGRNSPARSQARRRDAYHDSSLYCSVLSPT